MGWGSDSGSKIRDPEKTYPGSMGKKGTVSRIRIRDTDLLELFLFQGY
jgi:hypothetical protein